MLVLKLTASAVLALGLSGAAQALTLLDGPGCDTSQLTTSDDCAGTYSGNDANQNLDGLFGQSDWEEIAKVDSDQGTDGILTVTANQPAPELLNLVAQVETEEDEGATGGGWSVTGWDGWSTVMAVLKGGNSFSAYLLDLTDTSGQWNTLGLAKGNGKPGPGLSHFTLYGIEGQTPPPSTIPLPAAGWLMLGAIGGLGLAARRRKG